MAGATGSGRCDVATTVHISGPVFNGEADFALHSACHEAGESIAEIGATMVRANLAGTLRVETPIYRTRVHASAEGPGWKIHDGGMIYGPWLEGTGSRNRTTRFKGYATFRRTVGAIQARAGEITENVIRRYLPKMGG